MQHQQTARAHEQGRAEPTQPTSPTSIELRDSNVAGERAAEVAEALRRSSSALTELSLSYNFFKDDGGEAIAEALRHNTSLRTVLLKGKAASSPRDAESTDWLPAAGNYFGRCGVARIVEALLASGSQLHTLSLVFCHMGDTEAAAIAQALARNTSLTSLDLTWNHIGQRGAQMIAEVLQRNTSLASISLADNHVDGQAREGCRRALECVARQRDEQREAQVAALLRGWALNANQCESPLALLDTALLRSIMALALVPRLAYAV
eukprot:m51a1_g11115 putative nod3 protein (264) ;mRNA; r:92979-94163